MAESAQRFAETRAAHRRESAEDYVEVILELGGHSGHARVTDIATKLGVAEPTVTRAIKRLILLGLVLQTRYRGVSLTDSGVALALVCRERHQLVLNFLQKLGVDTLTAERDSEGIEHHVSEATLAAMRRYLEQ